MPDACQCVLSATRMPRRLLRSRGSRIASAAIVCASLGCGSRDLSIGRQDLALDASPGVDARDDANRDGPFVIIWRDDFDTLDPGRWEVASHTFEENYADFAVANAAATGGFLRLGVAAKGVGSSGKPYTAAEVRTWANFTCGKFLVRAKVAAGSGVTSTFFGFHDFFQNASSQNWNEIVLEASPPSRVDYVYTVQNLTASSGKDRVAVSSTVGFDTTQDFHVYGFEWTPEEVRYLVDGRVERSVPSDVAMRLLRPKRIVMSAYPSTRLAPSNSFDPAVLPAQAVYDWIEVYRYAGTCPSDIDGGDSGL